jgi:hypothetical protein
MTVLMTDVVVVSVVHSGLHRRLFGRFCRIFGKSGSSHEHRSSNQKRFQHVVPFAVPMIASPGAPAAPLGILAESPSTLSSDPTGVLDRGSCSKLPFGVRI